MILSDKTIRDLIDADVIDVTPEPDDEQIQPASLDVRMGNELYAVDYDERQEYEHEVKLYPGTSYIGHTVEYISLPNDVAAMLTGRSTVGRKGVIIHKTAGWIDPGFEGQLTLEIYNFQSSPVTIDIGSRVGQLVFFFVDNDTDGYDGQYQEQTGVTTDATL